MLVGQEPKGSAMSVIHSPKLRDEKSAPTVPGLILAVQIDANGTPHYVAPYSIRLVPRHIPLLRFQTVPSRSPSKTSLSFS